MDTKTLEAPQDSRQREPVRPPAAPELLGAVRLERSAHNEALSDVAAVPEPAGGSQGRRGGRGGRKELVGPALPLPSTATPSTRDKGPHLGGGAQVGPGAAVGALFER